MRLRLPLYLRRHPRYLAEQVGISDQGHPDLLEGGSQLLISVPVPLVLQGGDVRRSRRWLGNW